MIKIKSFQVPASLSSFLGSLARAGRTNLFSAAAASLSNLVRRHISRESARRHATAAKLGARPTGFLQKAARRTYHMATSDKAEVIIPSPGFARAFRPVTIAARKSSALTIPTHSIAYGRRVGELRSLGWSIFRPKGRDVLMGSRNGEEGVCLYVLKKAVRQRQDRGLLPSDNEIRTSAAIAMMAEIRRVARKAS